MFKWSFACEEMEPHKIVQVLYFEKVKCAKYTKTKRGTETKNRNLLFLNF